MKPVRVTAPHAPDGSEIARHVAIASTFRARTLGLLPRHRLLNHEGLLLLPGGSVHTLGMRFGIDVVFLGTQLRVLKIVPHLPPMRWAWAPRGTWAVLELAAGRAQACGLRADMRLIAHVEERV